MLHQARRALYIERTTLLKILLPSGKDYAQASAEWCIREGWHKPARTLVEVLSFELSFDSLAIELTSLAPT